MTFFYCGLQHKGYSFHPIYSQSVKPRSPRQHNYLLDVLIIYFLWNIGKSATQKFSTMKLKMLTRWYFLFKKILSNTYWQLSNKINLLLFFEGGDGGDGWVGGEDQSLTCLD
jgi:hypothetical protein